MKKIILSSLIMICSFLLVGCSGNEKIEPVKLEDKYYKQKEFVEIDKNKLEDLVKNKETFVIFIYQPRCAASSNFREVLENFTDQNNITIYTMSFTEMKNTELKKDIKYYPSFVVYQKGKMVAYLDANAEEDAEYYKDVENFKSWITKYIILENENLENEN